jgi:glycerol-3-phosphate dehydrogenase
VAEGKQHKAELRKAEDARRDIERIAKAKAESEAEAHGFSSSPKETGPLAVYDSDAARIRALMMQDSGLAERLYPMLPYVRAEVVWADREEMAHPVEDVLARRMRADFLNAAAGDGARGSRLCWRQSSVGMTERRQINSPIFVLWRATICHRRILNSSSFSSALTRCVGEHGHSVRVTGAA